MPTPAIDPDDDAFARQFVDAVLDAYPSRDLTEGPGAPIVEHISKSLVRQIPNFETDREFYTYGRWAGALRIGERRRWAYWEVLDSDYNDNESDSRGRTVTLFDTEDEAVERFYKQLIDLCDDFERPAPEEWPDDPSEREWQTERLARHIEEITPYWRALTGFPDDVIAYCVNARVDVRSTWETTRGNATPHQIEAFRMVAALRP